ncbi:methyl-accepting chemotaxis protein [Desulfocucumis palustris]|uniref:Methyl-accepting chemotaxis protein n=1 Tax=Desulfocucumis palustris TaxID=1898651 RepID=A0A2L2XJC1_9FIRM|nr:methyl-accepting chemotaxis protein [Desulfocucumis palustris]GBF34356.1 methyl-accepting chemotaxis protein [Desulfocucumis palustris]
MFSFFNSNRSKKIFKEQEICARADFMAALTCFSLAHNELVAYAASLKIREVAEKAADLAATTEEISATAEETSASTQQISAGMQIVKEGEQNNFNKTSSLAEMAKDANLILNNMVGNVEQLVEQIKNIENISQNVSEIADKTNLLSLNAAIEAARAGEHGRGFSVVAEEVRKLADQTKTAVKEVKNISDQMNKKAVSTVEAVGSVTNTFEQYLTETTNVAGIMSENMRMVEESTGSVDNIAKAAQQQALATENLAEVSEELANSADFGDILEDEAKKIDKVITPYMSFYQCDHVLSILAGRLNDHANFLRKVIQNAGKGFKPTSHHQCEFGKWYKNEYDRYKNIKEFVDIDEPHKRFHDAAEAFSMEVSLVNVNKIIDSSVDILEAFLRLSRVITDN